MIQEAVGGSVVSTYAMIQEAGLLGSQMMLCKHAMPVFSLQRHTIYIVPFSLIFCPSVDITLNLRPSAFNSTSAS